MGPLPRTYPMAESFWDAVFLGLWALILWTLLIIMFVALLPAVLIDRLWPFVPSQRPTSAIARWWRAWPDKRL